MIILNWIITAHVLAFFLFWLTNNLYHSAVNDFLADLTGFYMDYVRSSLILAGGIGMICLLYLFFSATGKSDTLRDAIDLLLAVFFLILFYGSFIFLFQKDPIQFSRLSMMVFYYRIYLDVCIILGIAFYLRRTTYTFQSFSSSWAFWIIGITGFILVWLVPVFFPPVEVYHGQIPPKPQIIAHRGAAALAPENTLASAQLAQSLGAAGLEVDIRLSIDGVPFLMHDEDLSRTTNVVSVFPGREKEPAENFTWDELQKLNAGSWFVTEDPFHTIAQGKVSPASLEGYKTERVPSLAKIIDFLQHNDLVFIFDLSQPPKGHPFHDSYFEIVLGMLHDAGLGPRVWYLLTPPEVDKTGAQSAEFTPTIGGEWRVFPSPQEMAARGYGIANSEYDFPTEFISTYHQQGLKVNLWTVDEPWLFSRQWLMGVDSITSNNVQEMIALPRPKSSPSYASYLVVWVLVGLLGLAVIVVR